MPGGSLEKILLAYVIVVPHFLATSRKSRDGAKVAISHVKYQIKTDVIVN